MKKILLPLILFLLFISKSNAQAPDWLWAKGLGGSHSGVSKSMTSDEKGNIYIVGVFGGAFGGSFDFDPGIGIQNLTSNGIYDIFISKYDSSGNLFWAKSMGGIGYDFPLTIGLDMYGNIYFAGYFEDTVDFDPGGATFNLISNGYEDMFISKIDSNGNFIWAKQIGGSGYDEITSIYVNNFGDVFLTGFFTGAVDFDTGTGIFNVTSIGYSDIFISKLDNTGNLVWVKNIGGTYNNAGTAITLDSAGNIYTTGNFVDTVDFDPGIGVYNLISLSTTGGSDMFLYKSDNSGNFIWAKSFGGSGSLGPLSIALDDFGNVLTTGWLLGSVDFDPDTSYFGLVSTVNRDIFISKLDNNGDFVWAKPFTGGGYDMAYSIQIDALGSVYTTGVFWGTVDFDPGVGVYNVTSLGNRDMYISKLSSAGNFAWVKSMGGSNTD